MSMRIEKLLFLSNTLFILIEIELLKNTVTRHFTYTDANFMYVMHSYL